MLNSQWPNIPQESIVCPRLTQPPPGSCPPHTWLWPGRPPRPYQDPGPPQLDLLVAWHLTIHSHLCQGLCPLFLHNDPMLCTTWFPETPRITSIHMDYTPNG